MQAIALEDLSDADKFEEDIQGVFMQLATMKEQQDNMQSVCDLCALLLRPCCDCVSL